MTSFFNVQVPAEHILYALNGKVVCLGRVQPDQVCWCMVVHGVFGTCPA